MSDTAKESKLSSWWRGIKAQFNRIIWPAKEQIAKETGVVLGVSIALGVIIAILDRVLLMLIDMIISI